jgi:GR25 family glycosyltransferase involved in LPS biosynthesis
MTKLYMKLIFTKIIIILLLVFLIFFIIGMLSSNIFRNNNLVIKTENQIDASFVTDEYLKEIKNKPNDIQKYKEGSLPTNSILNTNIEQFTSKKKELKFLKKIDKILFINLNHRKDRFKQINNEFDKMGFPNEKIKRIDAVNEKYNGHIGCCKSHIKAMNDIIKNNYNYTMVFEDDFVFNIGKDELDEKISNFLSEYKNNWDIIQLASVYTNVNDTNIDFIKKVNRASTSSAYIINKPFAKELLTDLNISLELMKKDMDNFNKKNKNVLKKKHTTNYALDQRWYGLQKKSRWYLFKPYIGKQGGEAGHSSIMSNKLEGFTSNMRKRMFTLKC